MSLTSAHWGTYHAHVKDGRLTGLLPKIPTQAKLAKALLM